MNISHLSFSALPPINVPFRYFLSAPLFLMAAAILMLFAGADIWGSRWHPMMLAITHLFTLGFMSMVMMGAIYQFLPVVGGIGVKQPLRIAAIAHTAHIIATVALVINFIMPSVAMLITAGIGFTIGFGVYLLAVGWVLVKRLSQGETIIGIRLAIICLSCVVFLGIALACKEILASQSSYFIFLFDKNYTDIHALLGGFGWGALLIVAVSFQVIPMFHVTPSLPVVIRKLLPLSIFFSLLILIVFLPTTEVGQGIILLILLLMACFAFAVLMRFRQRKRKVADTSILFWQFASYSLLIMVIVVLVPQRLYPVAIQNKLALSLGAFFAYFYIVSIIEAMLLKILPFLSYTHLQQLCLENFDAMMHLPHMHTLLKKQHANILFYLHLTSCALLMVTLFYTAIYWLLAIAIIIESSWLIFLMISCIKKYRRALIHIRNCCSA